MSLYTRKLKFALSLGYKSVAEAFKKYGKYKFETRFNKLNRKGIVLTDINPMYTLFENGDILSSYHNKILKKHKINTNLGPGYFTYYLRLTDSTTKTFQVARLIKFYFAQHSYATLQDMPALKYKDGNTSNLRAKNLVFDPGHRLVLDIAIDSRKSDSCAKVKDTDKNIMKISLLSQSLTTDEIGELFNVSGMSICRFKKRNNITISKVQFNKALNESKTDS